MSAFLSCLEYCRLSTSFVRRDGMGWDANVRLDVIASAAKQSILSLRGAMDCFAALAMTALQTSGKPAGNKNPEGNRHADPASSQRLPLATDPVAAGRARVALRDEALSAQRADAAGAA